MIFNNKSILFLFISLVISLIACSGDKNDITNESQVDLPDDFNHTAYWENNEKVQESCGKSDSLCIEEHWFNIGEPAGLSYSPVVEISSSSVNYSSTLESSSSVSSSSSGATSSPLEVSSSSEEISSSTESSSSEAISSSAEISSSSELSSSSSVVIQTVAAPTFSIAAGTYTTAQSVTLSTTTAGAAIYYTTDGSTPSTSSTLYSSAISVSATQTIKAIAVKTDWDNSAVASAEYTITGTVNTPTFSPSAGTYTTAQSVTLSTTTAGAAIYYTTDGSTPSTSSTLYSSAISVSATQTIKAIAVKTDWDNSSVASADYVINASTVINSQTCTYSSTNNTLACNEKTYKTTTIGTQVWMAENLAYLPQIDAATDGSEDTGFEDDPFYYVYDYTPSGVDEDAEIANAKLTTNYQNYGVLYNWNAAMDGASSSSTSPSGIQGVCPTGWHLPSDDEWEILATFVANDAGLKGYSGDDWTQIGQKLKTTTGWTSFSGISSDDAYGFSGLPGGYRHSNGSYNSVGNYGYWWSSTEDSSTHAYYRSLDYNYDYFYRYYYYKTYAYSVRCLQDTP